MYFQIAGTNVRLLGSMHWFPASQDFVPNWAEAAYQWSKSLVLEGDSAQFPPFCKTVDLQPKFSPHVWAALQRIWPTTSVPLNELQPWAIMLMLGQMKLQLVSGIEPRFKEWGAKDAKPIRYLEQASEAAASFASVPLNDVEASLALVLADLSLPQRDLEALYAAWITGERAQFFAVAGQLPLFSFPTIRKALLDSRNRAWAQPIEQLLSAAEPTLVVVGAAHLCGPANLEECLGREIIALS